MHHRLRRFQSFPNISIVISPISNADRAHARFTITDNGAKSRQHVARSVNGIVFPFSSTTVRITGRMFSPLKPLKSATTLNITDTWQVSEVYRASFGNLECHQLGDKGSFMGQDK
jgi:hypothetical protein